MFRIEKQILLKWCQLILLVKLITKGIMLPNKDMKWLDDKVKEIILKNKALYKNGRSLKPERSYKSD